MYESTYLTQDEAASVCGKAKDTIRRYRRLPNSCPRTDDTVEVAVSNFVAGNLLNPPLATADVRGIAVRGRRVPRTQTITSSSVDFISATWASSAPTLVGRPTKLRHDSETHECALRSTLRH